MANNPQSPSLSAKLKTRDAANRIKHGSPKLQEVLRERCRQRMKEKRGQLFDKRRQGLAEMDKEVLNTMTEIMRQEFNQLVTDETTKKILGLNLGPMTTEEALALQLEFITEEEQWIIQEAENFQNLLKEEDERFTLYVEDIMREIVMCPICKIGEIKKHDVFLSCSLCEFRTTGICSVADFGKMMKDSWETHLANCNGQPFFEHNPFAPTGTAKLFLKCKTCLCDFAVAAAAIV